MHHGTVSSYDQRGHRWSSTHRHAVRRADAEAFAVAVGAGVPRLDVGCGAGRYSPHLGSPLIALDASRPMLEECRAVAPDARAVVGDLEALPFADRSIGGAWSCMAHLHVPRVRLPLALADLHRVLTVGAPLDLQMLRGDDEGDDLPGDVVGGRFFAGWDTGPLVDVVTGAGFTVDAGAVSVSGDEVVVRATRARSLADTVGPGMRLLVCGLNPSLYAADAGVGFARPGNRFWPAATAAGLVRRDRDPVDAVQDGGVGMTDLVKRATRAASEVTADEYLTGLGRVTRMVEWLRPRAVCFVGLAGWRAVVDPRARPGEQPAGLGGRPVYLMPSTSGLNATSGLDELTGHLAAAGELADRSPSPVPGGGR